MTTKKITRYTEENPFMRAEYFKAVLRLAKKTHVEMGALVGTKQNAVWRAVNHGGSLALLRRYSEAADLDFIVVTILGHHLATANDGEKRITEKQ